MILERDSVKPTSVYSVTFLKGQILEVFKFHRCNKHPPQSSGTANINLKTYPYCLALRGADFAIKRHKIILRGCTCLVELSLCEALPPCGRAAGPGGERVHSGAAAKTSEGSRAQARGCPEEWNSRLWRAAPVPSVGSHLTWPRHDAFVSVREVSPGLLFYFGLARASVEEDP